MPEQTVRPTEYPPRHRPDHEMMRYFRFGHLPQPLAEVSAQFAELAKVVAALPDGSQRDFSLQALIIAKDAAVRSVLPKK